jgi:hypothetical protein
MILMAVTATMKFTAAKGKTRSSAVRGAILSKLAAKTLWLIPVTAMTGSRVAAVMTP